VFRHLEVTGSDYVRKRSRLASTMMNGRRSFDDLVGQRQREPYWLGSSKIDDELELGSEPGPRDPGITAVAVWFDHSSAVFESAPCHLWVIPSRWPRSRHSPLARFAPKADMRELTATYLLGANSDLTRPSKKHCYSIPSSARASKVGGTSKP